MEHLDALQHEGVMTWRADEQAWVADPEGVVRALTTDGFQEYKREVARDGRTHTATGGMWQGLDPRSGSVATVIWATPTTCERTHVFIEIDGRPVQGSAWTELDDAVLNVLAAAGHRLTLEHIATRVGVSEDSVRSIVSMLAEQGKVRIVAVELARPTKVSLPAGSADGEVSGAGGPS